MSVSNKFLKLYNKRDFKACVARKAEFTWRK